MLKCINYLNLRTVHPSAVIGVVRFDSQSYIQSVPVQRILKLERTAAGQPAGQMANGRSIDRRRVVWSDPSFPDARKFFLLKFLVALVCSDLARWPGTTRIAGLTGETGFSLRYLYVSLYCLPPLPLIFSSNLSRAPRRCFGQVLVFLSNHRNHFTPWHFTPHQNYMGHHLTTSHRTTWTLRDSR